MNLVARVVVALCLFPLAVASPASAQEIAFNDGWQFHRVDSKTAPAAPPARANWSTITLPHTTRIEPRIVTDQWQGIAFYRKRFDAPEAWRGKTVLLRFEAAMNIASISVNGHPVARHLGGYLPFTIDLTPHLRPGGSNEILVRLDNRDSRITGPKPLKGLDFNTYGGLYRGVRLLLKPPVHLSDEMLANTVAGGGLFVTYPEASSERASVAVAADVRNASASNVTATVTHRLFDGPREVARSAGTLRIGPGATARNAQQLSVLRPRLWSPRSPNLYRLVTTISTPDTQDDTTETRIGIRRIGFAGNRFVINGERMFLRGVNRHQEYPYVGYAISPQADYRDAKLIKEAGFDYVRLSHYPHSPAFMKAADELGLMLVDAIPGWQFYDPDPRFRAHVLQTCRDMIRRDRNHPSVLAWECSLNESDMPPEFVAELNQAVHEEYPGDQAWSAGWLAEGFDIHLQARQHRLQHYETPDRPYIVSEYGDWEYYAKNAGLDQAAWADLKQEERTSRQAPGVGEKRLLQQATNIQEAHNDNFGTPAFADGYWVMFDYNRGYADDLETSGIMSLERLPKFSYFFFRSQRDPGDVSPLFQSGPMVKIASYWDAQSSAALRVYSNAEEVELLLNGRSLGRKRPDRGKNANQLAHPPFLFDAGRFEPGVLEARAFIGGRQVAFDRVQTPGAPHHLDVTLDSAGVPIVAGDLVFARAHARDRNQGPTPTHNGTAHFSASGDSEIVGPADVPLEAGIASALIRVKRASPRGSIEASSGGLRSGSLGEQAQARASEAVLFDQDEFGSDGIASIIHEDHRTTELAAQLLARDLQALSGRRAVVSRDLAACARLCVVIGRYDSLLVERIARDAGVSMAALQGQWERYERILIPARSERGQSYLLIAGSDARGAVWGVIDLTRELGVSAWEWWADVTPRRAKRLAVAGERRVSDAPSVRYRGIFLNDEDWGLQPWAATTHEPEVGDIGPRTYARIFELLWRLKANTIWPAMHDSTRPFYQVPGNAEAARDYSIVVGTSHAEPMMRNNVREWDDEQRGEFNYFTNRNALIDYWRERAEEVKGFENLYTIGLRGKHDSGMQGANSPEHARTAMEDAIAIQRDLLAKALGRPADQVPQVVTLYKEVLDVYSSGLEVPDDVTLVWPEDNYGYIHQLSTAEERTRSGGSGIYYHLSYWGRPHDYLWLGTTHPALIREQLDRAWTTHARRIWIFNVGDIKPAEYLADYALELAFNREALAQSPRDHLQGWAARQFGEASAAEIAGIMTEYYDLAFERRPEFMGFGQVEPIQPNRISDFVRTGGDEAERRLDRYAAIVRRAEAVAASMPADRADAFFQLVLYPVRGAASLNERILKLDLAAVHAKAGRAPFTPDNTWDIAANRLSGAPRADSNALVAQARAAHQRIVADTAAYNAQANGKWNGIMDMAPRRLPVFQEPIYPTFALPSQAACGIDATNLTFVSGRPATRSFTLYSAGKPVRWSYGGQRGVTPSSTGGNLDAASGFSQRIALAYDGGDALHGGRIQCGNDALDVDVRLTTTAAGLPPAINRIISIPATVARSNAWEPVPGLGSQGSALRARLDLPTVEEPNLAAPLTYLFATDAQGDAELRVVGIPVHPLTSQNRLRLAIRIDAGPLQTLDFQTFGRSDEWKRNVLTNTAVRTIPLRQLPAGPHRLDVYPLDPGFILDRIDVRLDGAPDHYGACCHTVVH